MKLVVVLTVCFLAYLSSASFIDGLKEAVTTVEDDISILLSNVITDVRETIDCSILAVEEALSFSGIFPEPVNDSKCKKDTTPPVSAADVQDHPHNNDIKKTSAEFSIDTNLSLVQVNESLRNTSSKHDAREKNEEELKIIKTRLEKENSNLLEVTELLKKEITITSTETVKPPSASKLNSLKRSREKEKSNNNLSGARDQPNHVIEKVIDLNGEKKNGSFKDINVKINMTNSTEASKIANSTKPLIKTVVVNTSNVEHEKTGAVINDYHKQSQQKSTESPKTMKSFKDVTRIIMNTQTPTTQVPSLLHSTSRISSSAAVTPTPTTTKTTPSLNKENNDYYSFLDVISLDDEHNKKAVEQAQTLMKDAVLDEQLMENFYNENNDAVDVFDNWF